MKVIVVGALIAVTIVTVINLAQVSYFNLILIKKKLFYTQ